MKKNIHLTLTGKQRDDAGEELVTEVQTAAEMYEQNGSLYILYEEIPEDGGPVSKNTIKLKNQVLELTKRGALATRMVFKPGTEHMTDYATPYGCLKLGVFTEKVTASPHPEGLTIRAEYTLTSDGSLLSRCCLTLTAREVS